MMDDNGNFLKYSNKEKIFNRKQQKYLRIIKNHKDKLHITELENKLSSFNFKTCDLEKFKCCIKEKTK